MEIRKRSVRRCVRQLNKVNGGKCVEKSVIFSRAHIYTNLMRHRLSVCWNEIESKNEVVRSADPIEKQKKLVRERLFLSSSNCLREDSLVVSNARALSEGSYEMQCPLYTAHCTKREHAFLN